MRKIAIDFDSANTNIYKVGSGLVLSESTVCAVSSGEKYRLKAIGEDAKKLIGKTSENTKIVFPVFEGEIVSVKVASGLLEGFLKKIDSYNKFERIEAVFGVPCGATSDMIEKYERVASNVGINKVYFVEAPLLSALGQHAPVSDYSPCFVIDMAGGTTNVGALTMSGIIAGVSVNFGSNKISTDIIDYIADNYGMQIGLLSAERLKREIGSLSENDGLCATVNGRDVEKGTPRSLSLKAFELFEPVKAYFDKVCEIANSVLIKLPPEVSAEIRRNGIFASGVACMIFGAEKYLSKKLGMKVTVADNPDKIVALGGGIAISDKNLLKKIALDY